MVKNEFDMLRAYDFELYAQHRKKLIQKVCQILLKHEIDELIISSGELIKNFVDDQCYPFKCNPYFTYFCPIDEPYHFIHIKANNPDDCKLYLFEFDDFWHPKSTAAKNPFSDFFKVEIYTETNCRCSFLSSKTPKASNLAFIGYEAQTLTNLQNPKNLLNELNALRMVKSDFELHCMKMACMRAKVAHHALKNAVHSYNSFNYSERDYFFIYSQSVNKIFSQFPYPPIIACNQNASFLHYHRRSKKPPLLPVSILIDAGVSACGYASDVSRTYLYELDQIKQIVKKNQGSDFVKDFSEDAYNVFALMLDSLKKLHSNLINSAAKGLDYNDLTNDAVNGIWSILTNHGIISAPNITKKDRYNLTRVFFPHSLGHMLGLQVHDVFYYNCNKNDNLDVTKSRGIRKLQVGNVFTIEPGIYFISMLFDKWFQKNSNLVKNKSIIIDNKLLNNLYLFGGMRWEDNIYINSQGKSENLSKNI